MSWARIGLWAVLLWLLTNQVQAQSVTFGREWEFARYLTDKGATDEATLVMQTLAGQPLSPARQDSLRYLQGWTAYGAKSLDEAADRLLSVSAASPFYMKSQYFGAYCLAFQHRTDSAQVVLTRIPALTSPDSTLYELRAFERAGVALLQRRFDQYDRHRQAFRFASYALSEEEKRLDQYATTLRHQPRRSAVVAGLLSAVVPGLGKAYAGKRKQGIAAFLPVLTLGLLTLEGYRKDGPTSLRFLGFGSLFTLFYVGNIWGSALTVKVKRDEIDRTYDTKILFDLHIPLRTLLHR
jgi:hypothetical protein